MKNLAKAMNFIYLGVFLYWLRVFWTERTVPLCVASVISGLVRGWVNNAGGHRYFGHKSFKCHPYLVWLFCIVESCNDIGMLMYWTLMHDVEHHQKCEQPDDRSSPYNQGFWFTQFGVFPDDSPDIMRKALDNESKMKRMETKFEANIRPFLNLKVNLSILIGEQVFWIVLASVLGFHPLLLWFWLNCAPKVYAFHAIHLINSWCHVYGTRPYVGNGRPPYPNCLATNSIFVTVCTLGEGWHNNHHAFAKSSRQGLVWYEPDFVFWSLCFLAKCGLVWDIIVVTDEDRKSVV